MGAKPRVAGGIWCPVCGLYIYADQAICECGHHKDHNICLWLRSKDVRALAYGEVNVHTAGVAVAAMENASSRAEARDKQRIK